MAENSTKDTKLVILTRTTRRPHYFEGLVKSVSGQENRNNIHLFVCYERLIDRAYVDSALDKCPDLKSTSFRSLHRGFDAKQRHESKDYKLSGSTSEMALYYKLQNAPFNLHLNELLKEARDFYEDFADDIAVVYLDDDDCFSKPTSATQIVEAFEQNKDKVIQWLVDFNDKVVPENIYWGKPPEIFHFSGIGFAHALKYSEEAVWDKLSCSDYRVAKKLVDKYGAVYVPDLLTKIQRKKAGGNGRMDDISKSLTKKQIFNYHE